MGKGMILLKRDRRKIETQQEMPLYFMIHSICTREASINCLTKF